MGLGLTAAGDCGCGCGGAKKSDLVKAKYSFYSALVFFLLSNPETYQLTRKLFGGAIAGEGGCPKSLGLFLHMAIFFVIVFI